MNSRSTPRVEPPAPSGRRVTSTARSTGRSPSGVRRSMRDFGDEGSVSRSAVDNGWAESALRPSYEISLGLRQNAP